MDPVTTAIVAALTVGATSGITETGKRVIADAYDALKTLLKQKVGEHSEVVKCVDGLEAKPTSTGRQATLSEEVAATHVDQDPEILHAAQVLLDHLRAQPGGEQHIQQAIGSYIAQAEGGSTATVNVDRRQEP